MSASKRRVVVIGSTGSIGTQALDVVRRNPDRLEIVGLVTGRDSATLEAQAREFGVTETGLGSEAAVHFAAIDGADIVLNAIVGATGLAASVAALEAGKVLALANKESLVAGGEVCTAAAERGGGRIEPVDSEHAALKQCLAGCRWNEVEHLILTASGGPFRNKQDLSTVTPEQALAHPTWSMGRKITIDSATLMNKGLEVIEAHHLFALDYERIRVVVHPQSIVHGIVEMIDGSLIMQAAPPDMRIPIAAALLGPGRHGSPAARLDLPATGSLTFEEVDGDRFPCVGLAFEAGRMGGSLPAVLNAANEVAVEAFLDNRVAFTDIPVLVEGALARHEPHDVPDVDAVLQADGWARTHVREALAVGASS